jgi:hypothetical protein
VTENPFPDFPVATLQESMQASESVTAGTSPICQARVIVDEYLESLSTSPKRSFLVPVRGDFGAGKTHLLKDVAERVRVAAPTSVGILAAAFLETDPLTWYRTAVGPQIIRLPIEDIVLQAYSAAARAVAARSSLTVAAVDLLQGDPASARDMVSGELLSPSDVELTFRNLLEEICSNVGDAILGALTSLLWQNRDIALRWLSGEELSEREQALSGLTHTVADERTASNILAAVAALYRYLGQPFVVLLDELEQFTRHDKSLGTRRNITWLKRLLERLAAVGAMTFVAGHWTAWEEQRDYLDRFSQQKSLDLSGMSAADVIDIVNAFVLGPNEFTEENALGILEWSSGNMRRALAVLHQLYSKYPGFLQPLPPEAIAMAAQSLASRVEPEHALEDLERVLVRLGLSVRRGAIVQSGLVFDLVGFADEMPAVVLDLKHATYQARLSDQLQRFIERFRAIKRFNPTSIGCFVAYGAVDDRIEALIGSAGVNVFVFTIAHPDFAEQFADTIARELRAQAMPSATPNAPQDAKVTANEEDSALLTLLNEIQKVKESQSALLEQVQSRLANQGAGGEAMARVAEIDASDQLRQFYDRATKRPKAVQMFIYALGGYRRIIVISTCLILGVIGFFITAPLSHELSFEYLPDGGYGINTTTYNNYVLFFQLLSSFLIVAGLFLLVGGYFATERYFQQRDRLLYNLYVREVPLSEMANVSLLFDDYIEHYGPYEGRRRALRDLESKQVVSKSVPKRHR